MDARELKDTASDYFRKGRFAKAAEAYQSLTKLEPKEFQHYIKLGDSHRRDGRKEQAIVAYREAVDGYANQGVMIKAIAACKLILEIDPGQKQAQEALAQLCAKRYMRREETGPIEKPRSHAPIELSEPDNMELPDVGDTLELDEPIAPKAKAGPAAPIRPLPPTRREAPRPEPTPPPRGPAPVLAPVGQIDLPESGPMEAIELGIEMPDFGTPAAPAPAARSVYIPVDPTPEQGEIELDLGLPAQVPAGGNRRGSAYDIGEPTAEPIVGNGIPADEIIEEPELIEADDELPPGITLITAETTAEHEVLSTVASSAGQPRTAMAEILAKTSDFAEDLDLLSVTTRHSTQPARMAPRFTDRGASATPPPESDLFIPAFRGRTGPQTKLEDHEIAQLAEEAAFDLVPKTDPEPPVARERDVAPLAVPSSDLQQENVPLFSELPKDAFVDLLEQMAFRRVDAGETIIREGDLGKSIFILASGRARVVKGLNTMDAIELAVLDDGAFFGEMALLNGAPRVASVVAVEDSEILELTEDLLRQITQKHPTVAQSLKKFYRQRLLANVMAISPLFRAFDRPDRKALVEKFKLREVKVDEKIIAEGQASDGLYVVMHGTALVTKNEPSSGRAVPLAVLKEGDVFGEMALLTRKPAGATVTAKRRTLVLRLPKASFDELMFTHPAVLEVVSELSDQRTRVNEQILTGQIDSPREVLAFL